MHNETISFRQPNRLDLMSDAEKSITEAMHKVEESGASENLTNAVIKLSQARDLVYEHYRTNNSNRKKFHVVEYAGYFNIQDTAFYDTGKNILNAEEIGYEEAKKYGELIEKLLNEYYATQTN